MDHIKEKLSKITPSIWKCHLRSTSGSERKENASSPDVTTVCYLSLEPPSDYLCKTDTLKKSTKNNCKVNENLPYMYFPNVFEIKLLGPTQLNYFITITTLLFQVSSGNERRQQEDETLLIHDLQIGAQDVAYFYTMASSITRNLPGQ